MKNFLNKEGVYDYRGYRDFYEQISDKFDFFMVRRYRASIYPAHFHSANELYYINDGTVSVSINGDNKQLNKGDILFLNAFDIHSISPIGRADVVVFQFGEMFLRDLKKVSKDINFENFLLDHDKNFQIGEYLNSMYDKTLEIDYNWIEKQICVNVIIDMLYKNYGATSSTNKKEVVQDIIKYIYRNSHDTELGLKKVSELFGYSEVSMSRIFHKTIGINIKSFINMVRLINVKRMLDDKNNDKKNIIDIVYECGFGSLTTYYRCKRELMLS